MSAAVGSKIGTEVSRDGTRVGGRTTSRYGCFRIYFICGFEPLKGSDGLLDVVFHE